MTIVKGNATVKWGSCCVLGIKCHACCFFIVFEDTDLIFLCFRVILKDLLYRAPVAHLDRATASGAVGGGFEPRRVHHFFAQKTAFFPISSQSIPVFFRFECYVVRQSTGEIRDQTLSARRSRGTGHPDIPRARRAFTGAGRWRIRRRCRGRIRSRA